MTKDVITILKDSLKANPKQFMADFVYRLENYSQDFLWSRKEIAMLWRYCSEFVSEGNIAEYSEEKEEQFSRELEFSGESHGGPIEKKPAEAAFLILGTAICKEKVLRQIKSSKDREFWRKILEYDHDEHLQKAMLTHFLAYKKPNYMDNMEYLFSNVLKEIVSELSYFNEENSPPNNIGVDLKYRVNELLLAIFNTIKRGKSIIEENIDKKDSDAA